MNKPVSRKKAQPSGRQTIKLGRSNSHRKGITPFRIDTDESVADIMRLIRSTQGLQPVLGLTVRPGKFEVNRAGYEPDTGYRAVSFRTWVQVRGRIFGPGSVHLFDDVGWCGVMSEDEFLRWCHPQPRPDRRASRHTIAHA
jgi:hypothetical protein